MTKTNQRRRVRARRTCRRKKRVDSAPKSVAQTVQEKRDTDIDLREDRQEGEWSILTHAVRAVGIAPITLLVVILGSHQLYPGAIPLLFQPILDKQIAVLTLSAGHAGIIGLLISNRGRSTWSALALLTAATATALAGYRTIGESTVGQFVALSLALLTIPAVWPERLSAKIQSFWALARTLRGISTILLVASVVWIAYYQSQYENYIRDFILIPLAILAGIVIAACVLWLLFRLGHRYVPTLFAWLRSRVAAAYRTRRRHWGKQGD